MRLHPSAVKRLLKICENYGGYREETRLKQAEQAEWNWPSTRRRCEVQRIEDEIQALNDEEFVVPF